MLKTSRAAFTTLLLCSLAACTILPTALIDPPVDSSIKVTFVPESPRVGQVARIEGSGAWKGTVEVWLGKPGAHLVLPEYQDQVAKLGETTAKDGKWSFELKLAESYSAERTGVKFFVMPGTPYSFVFRDSEGKIWGQQVDIS